MNAVPSKPSINNLTNFLKCNIEHFSVISQICDKNTRKKMIKLNPYFTKLNICCR